MPWIGGALAGGGAVLGGLFGSSAASDAADAQAQAAAESNATQRYIFDKSREDNLPFLQNGTAASNKLAQLLGLGSATPSMFGNSGGTPTYNAQLYDSNPLYRKAWDELAASHYAAYGSNYTPDSDRGWIERGIRDKMGPDGMAALTPATDFSFGSLLKPITRSDIESDPTYSMGLEFGLNEGTKGINRQASATGNLLSGATLKALTKYGNDYAGTKANDAVNRISASRQQTYSMLSGMSGGGQAAAGQTQAAGQNYGNNVSQTAIGLGNARGASSVAGANAIAGGINSGIGYYQGNQLLQALQRNGGGSVYGTPGYGGSGTFDANAWERYL
jgi:hypothetical protein